jgi:hypothetical protein
MFTQCKVDLAKRLNTIGRESHGGEIRLKRKNVDKNNKTERWKKRQKGKSLAKFYNMLDDDDSAGQHPYRVAKLEALKTEEKEDSKVENTPSQKKMATRMPSPKKPRAKQSDDNDSDYKVSFAFFG